MWCVKSVEKTSNPGYLSEPIQIINLIDYDTGEKSFFYRYEEKNGTKIDKWENDDIVEVGTICGYCGDFFYIINKPLYKLISIIESIDLIGTTGIPESFKVDKAIYQVDLHGVVWRYGSRYFNLLSILIYVDLNYCNITNCSKLVLYPSKGSSLKYIITFNKPQFKIFFSKLRLKTNNFERSLIL